VKGEQIIEGKTDHRKRSKKEKEKAERIACVGL